MLLLLVANANAEVPAELAGRTLGVGLELRVRGIPLGAQDTTSGTTVSVTSTNLFQPGVSARFQLGILALAPRIGFGHSSSDRASEDERTVTTHGSLGLDARLYTLHVAGFHLVGIAGTNVFARQETGPADWESETSRYLTWSGVLGASVEWIPTARFSVELNARTTVAGYTIQRYDPDPQERDQTSFSLGISGLAPSIAAHVWF